MHQVEKNNNILLSIICRSYNCELFIESALKSLMQELDESCELIIVDNGSTDNTVEKINTFLNKFTFSFKINFIQQKNLGPGGACNTGIRHAKGRYVGFLDGDDIYLKGLKNSIFSYLEDNVFDIIEFNFIMFSREKNIFEQKPSSFYNYLDGEFNTSQIVNFLFAKNNWYPFTRFYKRKVWENVRFKEGVYYEDIEIYKVFLNSKKIKIIKQALMGYRKHQGSITAIVSNKKLRDLIDYYWSINEELECIKILKLRLARTINFFTIKLRTLNHEYKKIEKDLKKDKLAIKTLYLLKFPDLFFYLFPNLYNFINFFRLIKF